MPALVLEGSVGLNGVNRPDDVMAAKTRLIDLGFTWLAPVTPTVGPTTVAAIKLFQAIKNGIDVVNNIKNDGLIAVEKGTHLWLRAANAPRWLQLPLGSREEGYFNSEVADGSDNHDFGTDWLADTLADTGAAYRDSFLASHPAAALLTINDASRPRGGDTPSHAGHESGLVCDLRLPRKDGGAGGILVGNPAYDREAMRAMLRAFRAQPLADRVFLSDDVLAAEGLCRPLSGHDNHAHFEIRPPLRVDDV
jgi:hypothetical protein